MRRFLSIEAKILFILALIAIPFLLLACFTAYEHKVLNDKINDRLARDATIIQMAQNAIHAAEVAEDQLQNSMILLNQKNALKLRLAKVKQNQINLNESKTAYRLYTNALAWGTNTPAFRNTNKGENYHEWVKRGLNKQFIVDKVPKALRQSSTLADIYFAGFYKHANDTLTAIKQSLKHSLNKQYKKASLSEPEMLEHYKKALSFMPLVDSSLQQIISETNLLTKRSKELIDEQELRLIVTMLVLSILLFAILVTIGWIFARYFISSPIKKLTLATQAVAHQDFSYRIKATSADELGELTNTFNQMLETLDRTTISKNFFMNTVNSMGSIVFITDPDFSIQTLNNTASEALGYDRSRLLGESISRIFSEGINPLKYQLAELQERKKLINLDVKLAKINNHLIPALLSVTAIHDDQDKLAHYIFVAQDITKLKHAEEQIIALAEHDVLTGLPNRANFEKTLKREIARAKRHNLSFALLLADIDNFKLVNDSLGHDTGDQLLMYASKRMEHNLNKEDFVARIGGDEFHIILVMIDDKYYPGEVAKRLVDCFQTPFEVNGHKVHISISIGIALFPSSANSSQELIKNADIAMYRAKELGRNNFQYYSEKVGSVYKERLHLEVKLHEAIKENQLFVEYQPQYDIQTKKITGMEALLRWQLPDGSLIPPEEFIPIAERTGLIISIGEWVLRKACLDCLKLIPYFGKAGRISVNVSPFQLIKGQFVEMLRSVIEETGIKPEQLELEITETAVMTYLEHSEEVLQELGEIGVSLSIDDFGTGYSSLSKISKLPIKVLKIDRSLISDVNTNVVDTAIVYSIISLASNLSLKVVAEGLETQEQFNTLIPCKSLQVQGFYFNRPMGLSEIEKLLNEQ